MDLLDLFAEPLLEFGVMVISELWTSGSYESKCKVQTLFGNDVWWNERPA
jgi:hypothetical protein